VSPAGGQVKRRWRFYSTAAGRRPVGEFIDGLSEYDAAEVHAAMRDVRDVGLRAARHLRGEIYEVRAEGADDSYRILFATEGKKSRVLLSLVATTKHTQQTPPQDIRLAERRLTEWRHHRVRPRRG
jgi:phage-related protein